MALVCGDSLFSRSHSLLRAWGWRPLVDATASVVGNLSALSLARGGEVALDLHDVQGRRMTRMASGHGLAGEHRLAWDRVGADGRRLAPGVYLLRLTSGTRTLQQRVILGP